MNFIVLDLEWNQGPLNARDERMPVEIIEIGAVKLDENFKKKGTYQKLIKPKFYKKINPITSEITKIKTQDLEHEKDFNYVMKEFLRWCKDDYILCTFGTQDISELIKNMQLNGMDIPFTYPVKYIDIQNIVNIFYGDKAEHLSLEYLTNFFNIKQKGVYHRALGDALYTAEILKLFDINVLTKYISVDSTIGPKSEDDQVYVDTGLAFEMISCEYKTREEMYESNLVSEVFCPVCKKKVDKVIDWFSDNAKYDSVYCCKKHGYIEGLINIKKRYVTAKKEVYYGIKKIILIDKEKYETIFKRKELIIKKRQEKRYIKGQENNQECNLENNIENNLQNNIDDN